MSITIPFRRVDPTEKMRYKLDQAYWFIEKYGKRVPRETAWALRAFYNNLHEREKRRVDFEGGPIVRKNKRLGYSAGTMAARHDFADQMEKLFETRGGQYPYENKAVAELIRLAAAYDLMAAWQCAEDLGNLCLLPGWLMTKRGAPKTAKRTKKTKSK